MLILLALASLFAAAGLERGRFTEVEPARTPPFFADARAAWTGPHPDLTGVAVRIGAAAYHGRPRPRLFRSEVVRRFWQPWPGAGKALGFDLPAPELASCGRFFPPDSIGHLGFTGTSFWVHRAQRLIVILLSNRVHPTRDNIAIRQFRPQIHDTVMQALLTSV